MLFGQFLIPNFELDHSGSRPLKFIIIMQVSSHLPPTGESVEDVLSSPQFQAALSTFHSGLTSGQLGPLMSQFGLGDSVMQSAASGSKRWVGGGGE